MTIDEKEKLEFQKTISNIATKTANYLEETNPMSEKDKVNLDLITAMAKMDKQFRLFLFLFFEVYKQVQAQSRHSELLEGLDYLHDRFKVEKGVSHGS